MPTNKQGRRFRNKKQRGPRKGRRAPVVALGKSSAFADVTMQRALMTTPSKRVTLFYYDNAHEFTSTAGSVARYRFRANDCFDPDQTGTGHQPMGFDEMTKYYDQFTVIKSKISVRFCSENASVPMVCGVKLNDSTTNETGLTDIIENGYARTAMIVGTGGGNNQVKTIKLGCDVARYFGRPEGTNIINDPNLFGTSAASPVEEAYYQLFAYAAVNTTTVTCGFDVILEYDVVFWEPKMLVQQELKKDDFAVLKALRNKGKCSDGTASRCGR
jgi:hypothetical protein